MVPTFENWWEPTRKKAFFMGWHTPDLRIWVKDEAGYSETYLVSEIFPASEPAKPPKYGYRRSID